MKRALLVGLDYKGTENELYGCIYDVKKLVPLFKYNEDGNRNFDVRVVTDENFSIKRSTLNKEIENLFKVNSEDMDTILFYFSGHGYLSKHGGYLVTSDAEEYSEGVSMEHILTTISHSHAKNKVIILDCCNAGKFGEKLEGEGSILQTGVTILASSKSKEFSYTGENGGVFTELLSFALQGEAKNIFGEISASQIYSYIDSSLGSFEQRPLFKTNISKSVILRNGKPSLEKSILRKLKMLFPKIDDEYQLDPEHEPNINKDVDLSKYPYISKNIEPDSEKVKKFEILQKLNRQGLVKPKKENHMFYGAIHSDMCILTEIGKHYWRLCDKDRI
ncbi:MAG: caspase family protein [Cetobacterium sp.]